MPNLLMQKLILMLIILFFFSFIYIVSRWFDQTNNDWGPGIYDFLPLSDIDKYLNVEGTLRIKITFDVISEIK